MTTKPQQRSSRKGTLGTMTEQAGPPPANASTQNTSAPAVAGQLAHRRTRCHCEQFKRASAAPEKLSVGDEVWVRGEVAILEVNGEECESGTPTQDDYVEVSFDDTACGPELIDIHPSELCVAGDRETALREKLEALIQAGDDLRYDEYGVMEFPIGHLARKWDDAKAALAQLLAEEQSKK